MNEKKIIKILNRVMGKSYRLSKEESLAIASEMMKNYQLAHRVFEYILMHNQSLLYNYIPLKYKPDFTCQTLIDLAFEECYDGGKWPRMKTYRGDKSLINWVKMISSQAFYKVFLETHYFENSKTMDENTLSLKWTNLPDLQDRIDLINLVQDEQIRFLLMKFYVEKVDFEERCQLLGIDNQKFHDWLSKAHTLEDKDEIRKIWKKECKNKQNEVDCVFKKCLLEKGDFYLLREPKVQGGKPTPVNLISVLLDETVFKVDIVPFSEISSDNDKDFVDNVFDDVEEFENDLLSKVVTLERASHKEFFDKLIGQIIGKMNLSSTNSYIWKERFLFRTPAKVVAEKIHLTSAAVDLRYKHIRDAVIEKLRYYLSNDYTIDLMNAA